MSAAQRPRSSHRSEAGRTALKSATLRLLRKRQRAVEEDPPADAIGADTFFEPVILVCLRILAACG